jgi:hypothetical protein
MTIIYGSLTRAKRTLRMRHSTIMKHIDDKVLALDNTLALSFTPLTPSQVSAFIKAPKKRVDTRVEVLIYSLDGHQLFSYPSITQAAPHVGMAVAGLKTDIYVGRNLRGKTYT